MDASTPASKAVIRLPSISKEDAFTFHFSHFGSSAPTSSFPADDGNMEEDDGLGYYEDGVKRTLTDEQIAIFRHSEIESLRREQRHRDEAGFDMIPSKQPSEVVSAASGSGLPPWKKRRMNKQKQSSNVWKKERYQNEDGVTARRAARDLDEIKADSVELDY